MRAERRDWMADMAVDVPEGKVGDVEVYRFEVKADSIEAMRAAFQGRPCPPGTYTGLARDGKLWMSDTPAERLDHFEPAFQIQNNGQRVLIGGLGLGSILRFALLTEGVEHVDVVEIDPDVIKLVGPHYADMATARGIELVFHEDDMLTKKWPKGTAWSVAWFDIWPDLCTDDLAEHTKLLRSYAQRSAWAGCWGHELLRHRRRWERQQPWGRYL